MSLEVACPHCDSHLSLNTKPGEKARCPMCHQVFMTPQTPEPNSMAKFADPSLAPQQHANAPMPGGPGYGSAAPGHYQTHAPFGGYYGMPTSSMATISMILGIIGLVFFCVWFIGIPLSLLAIMFGAISFNECGGVAPRATGKGLATSGIVCGGISILLFVMFILVAGWSFRPFFWGGWF